MGRKLLAMFVAPASRWWRLPRSRNRSECARGILVIHYSWHSVLFGSIGVCRSRSLRFGKRHVGLCSLVNLSTRLNIDLVSRIRPSKTANTLFTSTVLFPLTKEQTNNELLPLRLLRRWSGTHMPVSLGPHSNRCNTQADTFSRRLKTTIIADFQKRVTHFQLE